MTSAERQEGQGAVTLAGHRAGGRLEDQALARAEHVEVHEPQARP